MNPPRDPQYLKWVRSLGCLICHGYAESAHTGGHGLGQKASDYQAVPLCGEHHRTGPDALDRIGRRAWEERFGMRVIRIVVALNDLYATVNPGASVPMPNPQDYA